MSRSRLIGLAAAGFAAGVAAWHLMAGRVDGDPGRVPASAHVASAEARGSASSFDGPRDVPPPLIPPIQRRLAAASPDGEDSAIPTDPERLLPGTEIESAHVVESLDSGFLRAMREPYDAIAATPEERQLADENIEQFQEQADALFQRAVRERLRPSDVEDEFFRLLEQRIERDRKIFGAERADRLEELRSARLSELNENALGPFPARSLVPKWR